MSDFIGVDVVGIEEIQKKLAQLPTEAADAGADAVGQYLLNVMRAYPPQKYVTRRAAYGFPFFTEKQRRWFFASLHDGTLEIPYRRTQGQSNAWQIIGRGAKQILVNEDPGARFTRGNFPGEQSRHERLVGWVPMMEEVKNRMPRILEIFSGAVNRAIKKLGLS